MRSFVSPPPPLLVASFSSLFHCRRALICLEVLSSCRCRVVYLKKQKHIHVTFTFIQSEEGGGDLYLSTLLHSYSPQCVQESLHTVRRLLFQHLDAALHLPTTKTTQGIRERSAGSHHIMSWYCCCKKPKLTCTHLWNVVKSLLSQYTLTAFLGVTRASSSQAPPIKCTWLTDQQEVWTPL